MLEIRWHGRGGQGSKTASILLAKIASATGKHIQAFPEYGPERMGAPVLAYTRISDGPIHLHCQVETPDLVVVLDPTLIGTVDITQNLKKGGNLIINSDYEPDKIRDKLGLAADVNTYTIDANTISEEEIGRIFPNTPMLGAINRVVNLMDQDSFLNQAREELKKKFSHKPEVIEGNMRSIDMAYREVKGLNG
ncbi:2-oxoacid:acceptor oxidoreductase family protein [Halothermothrix orenii]|uniref:Pyruvate ferredoxin oxidoreductase, gamma subunit n=1 Tax=Halothermothrix orenii (strain H 168 / OCM 544 / DSM 9562) TaxID=373903 RepID=B8CZW7_HALOH|nr:2-oxoacid:acceptor oxidoreductase family protein [Halothermothrix orenii]ACL70819.1 pyruvate ferredoxin oxidoreductase, gamma subunit [Halothermothrix orenii H 168]